VQEVVGFLFLALGGIFIVRLTRRFPQLRNPLIAAFLIRAAFALIHRYVWPLPDSQADAIGFELTAANWAQQGFPGVLREFRTGAWLYSWVVAIFYSFFGRSPLMAQAINVTLGSLIVYNVFRVTEMLWGSHYARRSAWCTALFPTLVLYSAITMREVMIVFPLTLGVLYFVRWLREDCIFSFLKALVMFSISVAFHTGILPVFCVVGLEALRRIFDALALGKGQALAKRMGILCLLVFVVFVIFTTGWGLEKAGRLLKGGSFVEVLAVQQRIAARGRAAYLYDFHPHSFFDLLFHVPIRIVYFLFMPFPWVVSSPIDLFGLTIAGLNFTLTVFFLRSLLVIWKRKESRWIFWMLSVLLVTFALSTSNYGTAIRHSAKLVPIAMTIVRIPRVKL